MSCSCDTVYSGIRGIIMFSVCYADAEGSVLPGTRDKCVLRENKSICDFLHICITTLRVCPQINKVEVLPCITAFFLFLTMWSKVP